MPGRGAKPAGVERRILAAMKYRSRRREERSFSLAALNRLLWGPRGRPHLPPAGQLTQSSGTMRFAE